MEGVLRGYTVAEESKSQVKATWKSIGGPFSAAGHSQAARPQVSSFGSILGLPLVKTGTSLARSNSKVVFFFFFNLFVMMFGLTHMVKEWLFG